MLDQDDPTMLTTTDVAGKLGCSVDRVRRMCEDGHFAGDAKTGVPGAWRAGVGSHWRIPLAAVEHFFARMRARVTRR
jgi:hypothetical protein